MPRFRRGEHLHQFRDHRAGQRAAGNDRRELPPLRGVAAASGINVKRNEVGHRDRNDRSDPYQGGQRRFEIHLVRVPVARLGDGIVDKVSGRAGHQHRDAHHEDPHQQLHLHRRALHAQQDERDQRHAGHAVGFESIRARADRIARIVARAVGDHARVARVVFLDLENDLHQVRTDVRDLGEDAAGDAQRRRAQRFADGKSDEARTRVIAGNEKQNEQHHQQFHADQHHADAHARLQRNLVNRIRFAAQPRKRRARVRKRVHANAEPGHAVAARNSQQAERQNDDDPEGFVVQQHAEVQHDHHRDERPQQHQEFALRDQVGFAGLVNQLGDFPHRAVYRQILQPRINRQAKNQPENAEKNSEEQQLVSVDSVQESHRRQVRQLQIRFAAHRFGRRLLRQCRHAAQQHRRRACRELPTRIA